MDGNDFCFLPASSRGSKVKTKDQVYTLPRRILEGIRHLKRGFHSKQWKVMDRLPSIHFQIWVFPKIWENPPNHPFVHRIFHDFNHPFWGVDTPIFGSTPIFGPGT